MLNSISNILNSIFLFVTGSAVGSFLNVLIDRLPKGKKITGRSYCDHCQKKIEDRDLVPILSFFILKGRCRHCGKKISFYYPLVELITGFFFVLVWNSRLPILIKTEAWLNSYSKFYNLNSIFLKFFLLGIISSLIVIFFTDVKYMLIPDELIVAFSFFSLPFLLSHLQSGLLGAVLLSLVFYFLYSVTRGKAMGFGDVKLALVIGLFQGLKLGFLSVYLAFIVGGVVGVILLLFKLKKIKSKIAFGPFLVIGVFSTMFFEKQILAIFEKLLAF